MRPRGRPEALLQQLITGLTQATPEKLANEIARCREVTDKPFGVNMTFLPSLTSPDYAKEFDTRGVTFVGVKPR